MLGSTLRSYSFAFSLPLPSNTLSRPISSSPILSHPLPPSHTVSTPPSDRYACKALDSHDLSECELYTTCEPCPMCWGAIQWSRVKKVYTGVDRFTAARFGFDDKVFYDEIAAQSDHYAVQLGPSSPGAVPTMLDVYVYECT